MLLFSRVPATTRPVYCVDGGGVFIQLTTCPIALYCVSEYSQLKMVFLGAWWGKAFFVAMIITSVRSMKTEYGCLFKWVIGFIIRNVTSPHGVKKHVKK